MESPEERDPRSYRFERLLAINHLFRFGASRRIVRLRSFAISNRALTRGITQTWFEDLGALWMLWQRVIADSKQVQRNVVSRAFASSVLVIRVALSGHSFKEFERFRRVVPSPLAYISRPDVKGNIHRAIRAPKSQREPLTNKLRFHDRMQRAGLAHPKVLALIDVRDRSQKPLPPQHVILKPLSGRGGSGIRVLRYDPLRACHFELGAPGTHVTGERLLADLIDLPGGPEFLVQELLEAHDDLVPFSEGALPTVRVLTGYTRNGDPQPIVAVFRMAARPGVGVDNFHKGGLASSVDLETGILSPAIKLKKDGRVSHHPLSGARIAGFPLPFWQQVRALAVASHDVFRGHCIIGLDIAITPSGPVIVEGNAQPDPDIHQRAGGKALGHTVFTDIVLSWV